jgi:FHA domain
MAATTGFAYTVPPVGAAAGFAVITDRFLCLVGSEATTAIADELYVLLDSDETHLDDVFDAVVTRHDLERFAIVEVIDPATRTFHLAVRGNVELDLEGATATRLSGGTKSGWISSEASGVSSLRLSLDGDHPVGATLPIRRGVVVTQHITIDDGASSRSAPELEILKTQPIQLPRLSQPRVTAPAQKSLSAKSTAIPIVLPARETVAVIEWLLILPDGSEIEPRIPVVIGRRPWVGSTDERSVVHIVAPSPHREISGVHLELSVVDGALHGRDLDSTNGTLVYSDSRPTRLLHEGRTTRLQHGDILDVGDAFSISVRTRN